MSQVMDLDDGDQFTNLNSMDNIFDFGFLGGNYIQVFMQGPGETL